MKPISSRELRALYQEYFVSQGHARISSAPLVPDNDPSVLFTTAGMHPLVPYLKGQPHPAGKRLTNVQKCVRTTDIDEVGDTTHATVFEMLGNWSLGDYFKQDAITFSWEFLTSPQWLDIDPSRLAVSVFAGDADAPFDAEAASTWQNLGVPAARIARLGKEDNWWPAGGKAPGPQGPDTEMFFWTGEKPAPAVFDPTDKRWVEIWNDVFMEFNRQADGTYEPLAQQNVDTGMGLERVVMALTGATSIYEIDVYQPLMQLITKASEQPDTRHQRIVADHIKAATFILADEHPVVPGKTDQGYVLRRLIRRAVRSARQLEISAINEVFTQGMRLVISQYQEAYPSLALHADAAQAALSQEIKQFEQVLVEGLRHFQTLVTQKTSDNTLSGASVFHLYETYGFPLELTQELAQEQGLKIDGEEFSAAELQHQNQSREASKGKFAGGLADHSKQSIKYHTATHLLHQALRQVLGTHVEQRGSNITTERLRFDFSHPQKLTPAEKQAVEDLVNEQIKADLPVKRTEMTVAQAKAAGALGLFEHKYGERVSVYSVGDFSCEICGGPHVEHTGDLGHFKITKEEAASAGIRRIKAVLDGKKIE